ncbi:MAG: hypothetical protein NVS9B14_11350 [Candidatus Acidiferrum sp.]
MLLAVVITAIFFTAASVAAAQTASTAKIANARPKFLEILVRLIRVTFQQNAKSIVRRGSGHK